MKAKLHTHPKMERELGVPPDHAIVDKYALPTECFGYPTAEPYPEQARLEEAEKILNEIWQEGCVTDWVNLEAFLSKSGKKGEG